MFFLKMTKDEITKLLKTGDTLLSEDDISRLAGVLSGNRNSPGAFIRQRRTLLLIHSYLYYHKNVSVVSDQVWQGWANDLAILQYTFPQETTQNFYDDAFIDWTGATGFDLPVDEWIMTQAIKEFRQYTGQVLE